MYIYRFFFSPLPGRFCGDSFLLLLGLLGGFLEFFFVLVCGLDMLFNLTVNKYNYILWLIRSEKYIYHIQGFIFYYMYIDPYHIITELNKCLDDLYTMIDA